MPGMLALMRATLVALMLTRATQTNFYLSIFNVILFSGQHLSTLALLTRLCVKLVCFMYFEKKSFKNDNLFRRENYTNIVIIISTAYNE